jgi:hypothetical protein
MREREFYCMGIPSPLMHVQQGGSFKSSLPQLRDIWGQKLEWRWTFLLTKITRLEVMG